MMGKPPFRDDLMCHAERVEYDFLSRSGLLRMPEGDCCDAYACIKLFKRIDPDVCLIQTFAGGRTDMAYLRLPSGEWDALCPLPGVEQPEVNGAR